MESTVLQPTAGQTVVSTDTGHHEHGHHGHHDGHDRRHWEVATDKREQTRVHETSRDFAAVEKSICDANGATGRSFAGVEKSICESTHDLEKSLCETQRDSLKSFEALSKQVSDAATATVVGFKDSLAIAYQVEGRALLEAAKNANAVSVQNTMYANAAAIQATSNYNLLSIEAVKNASAAELRAATIAAAATLQAQSVAAAAAAQAAECCCELKALILAQGEQTRSLFTANETQRLRDQVQALQLANSSLFARNVPPVQPLQPV